MTTLNELGNFVLAYATFLIINYLVFSVFGYWFFYHYLGKKIEHRQIQEKEPAQKQMNSDQKHSLITQLIFFVMGIGLFLCYKSGVTKIYPVWNERGIFYFFITWFFIHHLHDTYFYWLHRAMHKFKWLRKYHQTHHDSHVPTPYSAMSFHPVEAILQGAYWYIIAFLFPVAALWMFVFYSFMFYINMWGHTNYEFWHQDLPNHKLLKYLNTPTHHTLHHKYHMSNYSIYYNFWDMICKTNHHNYENYYYKLKEKTLKKRKSKILEFMRL